MNIPDYISPIVGYRVWQWDAAGLRSLNGEPWAPGKPLAAGCRYACSGLAGCAEAMDDAHEAPQAGCTCGVYAAKSLAHLRTAGYTQYGIHGEVTCGAKSLSTNVDGVPSLRTRRISSCRRTPCRSRSQKFNPA